MAEDNGTDVVPHASKHHERYSIYFLFTCMCVELAQKFMQVEVDVKCMQTNFGGRVLSGFGDFAPFQIWTNFPFEPWAIIYGGSKNTCTCMLSSIFISFLLFLPFLSSSLFLPLRYKSILLTMSESVLKKIQLHHNMDELQDIDDDTINDVSRTIM